MAGLCPAIVVSGVWLPAPSRYEMPRANFPGLERKTRPTGL